MTLPMFSSSDSSPGPSTGTEGSSSTSVTPVVSDNAGGIDGNSNGVLDRIRQIVLGLVAGTAAGIMSQVMTRQCCSHLR